MITPKFTRTVEDFICAHCGREVKGNGYTNHCPACLWSRHVDVNPGDRAAACGGMMEPVRIEKKGQEYRVLQRCVACGHERWDSVRPEDDFNVAIALSRRAADAK